MRQQAATAMQISDRSCPAGLQQRVGLHHRQTNTPRPKRPPNPDLNDYGTCPTWHSWLATVRCCSTAQKPNPGHVQSPNPHFFPVKLLCRRFVSAQAISPDPAARHGLWPTWHRPGPGQAIPLSLIQHLVTYTSSGRIVRGRFCRRRHQRSGCGQSAVAAPEA